MKQFCGFTTALSSLESMYAGRGSESSWILVQSHARLAQSQARLMNFTLLPPTLPESFSTNIHFLSGTQLSLSAIQFPCLSHIPQI